MKFNMQVETVFDYDEEAGAAEALFSHLIKTEAPVLLIEQARKQAFDLRWQAEHSPYIQPIIEKKLL